MSQVSLLWDMSNKFLAGGPFSHLQAALKRLILNRVKAVAFWDNNRKSLAKPSMFDDLNFIIKVVFNGVACST